MMTPSLLPFVVGCYLCQDRAEIDCKKSRMLLKAAHEVLQKVPCNTNSVFFTLAPLKIRARLAFQ